MHATAANRAAPWWRSLAVSFGIVVLCGSLAAGQQTGGSGSSKPKAKPAEAAPAKSLEDLLAAALKNNPDIRVAEAKLREAEAELNRARLQTTQKIVTLHRGLEAQKSLVQSAEGEFQRAFPSPEPARQKVLQAKAKLNEIEAEIAYLTGQQPAGLPASQASEPERALYAFSLAQMQWHLEASKPVAVQGTMASRIRNALDREALFDFEAPIFMNVIQRFKETLGDIPISFNVTSIRSAASINLHFKARLPLGSAMLAFQDVASLQFVVRPYGIFLTEKSALPPGAVLLQDFWKGETETEKLKTPPTPDKE